MMVYNAHIPLVAASATANQGTIVSGSTRSFLVLELDFQGQATASANNELCLFRTLAAGITPGTLLNIVPVDAPNMTGTTPALAFSGAASSAISYTTAPTVTAAAQLFPFGLNANGQRYFWRANPNLNNAIVVPGGGATNGITLTALSGTSNYSGRIQIAEL